jgi:hypothetical protein
MENNWTHWNYSAEDYAMIKAWSIDHGKQIIRREWLPETGFIVVGESPRLAIFLYFDTTSPVAFLDWPVSSPGTTAQEVRSAFLYAMANPVRSAMQEKGAEVIMTRTFVPFARTLLRWGWKMEPNESYLMMYEYTQEELAR